MNSSYCLNMSLCNNHENDETNISFYDILLNACARGTCILQETCSEGMKMKSEDTSVSLRV